MTTASLIIVKPMIYYLQSIGISKTELFDKACLDMSIMDDPDTRLTNDEVDRFTLAAYELSQDPYLGLNVGKEFRFSSLGLLGYFMENSKTGADVFNKLVKYQDIIGTGVNTQIEYEEKSFSLIQKYIQKSSDITRRICIEKILSHIIAGVRLLVDDSVNPIDIRFAFPEPDDLSLYDERFRCPIHFNAKVNAIRLDKKILQMGISSYDQHMEQYFYNLVGEELEKAHSEESFSNKVSQYIVRKYPYGNIDAEQVASEFNMGLRTFQRRLKEEETSFKLILDEIKRSIALSYVKSNSMSLSEISYILGFSELSSFYRTFRRWTGKTPKVYRDAIAS